MSTPLRGFDHLVLEEFRLADGASFAEADGILAVAQPDGVPLMTSIADDRDVASVRAVPPRTPADADLISRTALGSLVSRWESPRTYRTRIAESSPTAPTAYRLAVTESGLNDGERALPRTRRPAAPPLDQVPDARTLATLLWIGAPVDTHAGLLVLVGDAGEGGSRPDPEWPLPLSQQLGVRIYRGRARD